jgi:hypothetical protein
MPGGDPTAATGSRAMKLASRFYVLATTYLVARLLLNRVLSGAWGLGAELAVHMLAVAMLQLGVLALESWLTRRRRPPLAAMLLEQPGTDR